MRFRCRRPRLALAPHRCSRGVLRERSPPRRARAARTRAPRAALADAGVELRADAIEQIRRQRGHSSNGSGPRRGAETLSGTAAPGDRRDMIPSRPPPALGRSREVRAGNTERSKPQTPRPRPRAPSPGQQPQTVGGDPSSGYDLLGVYQASTPEHNPGLSARDRCVRDIHHFHGFRVLGPPRCAAVRSSVHDS